MKQIPLSLGPEPDFSFANLVTGPNAAALELLRGLKPGAPPVFLWGPPGCGKTHLLRALAGAWQSAGAQVGWYDSSVRPPWELPTNPSLILLDDCQDFDEAQQHAAFQLFVEAATQGLALVAAGTAPPVDLPLREDLRTRLGWGPIYALQPLAEPEVRAALRREADRRGIFLSDEVMDYLLTRFARDLKSLMGLLDRLDEFSMAHKRAVTVPLLRQMLSDKDNEHDA